MEGAGAPQDAQVPVAVGKFAYATRFSSYAPRAPHSSP